MFTYEALKPEYKLLWDECEVLPQKLKELNYLAKMINCNKVRYSLVSNEVKIPWEVIGIIHCMECACDFSKHIHNGDSLEARTVHVPFGRPRTGVPPFTWEYSAVDAFKDRDIPEFTPEGMLYFFEAYNGFGYRINKQAKEKNAKSPYLWSFTNHATCGKFVKDGSFDITVKSRQAGAAAILRVLNGLNDRLF
jgi:lysozyme family protein